MSEKISRKHNNNPRRVVYFSGKLLSSRDLTEDQDYFRDRKNPEDVKNKPIYIVELSSISSRYIGETEKNINSIFRKLKNMNGILLFDEADSLFGKRTNVKDSHDKYANIETSYLLEKIQNYKGVIFTTFNIRKPITKQYITKLDYVICLPIKKQRSKSNTR